MPFPDPTRRLALSSDLHEVRLPGDEGGQGVQPTADAGPLAGRGCWLLRGSGSWQGPTQGQLG